MTARFPVCRLLIALCATFLLSACAETELVSHYAKKLHWPGQEESAGTYKIGKPYRVGSVWYYPQEDFQLVETGIASWYGPDFHGKKTANGEVYDQNELTAAHRSLQMPSLVKVTNLENGRSIVVRINDRGPFKHGRVIDLSKRGAELLGFKAKGTARVRLEVLEKESRQIAAAARRGLDTSRLTEEQLASVKPLEKPVPIVKTAYAARGVPDYGVTGDESLPESLRTPTITVEDLAAVGPGRRPARRAEEIVWQPPAPVMAPPKRELLAQGRLDREGHFMPAPVVTQAPVRPTGIFVQAGSFAVYENAERLSVRLGTMAPVRIDPVTVHGRQLYRVRLGPIASIDEADAVLARVVNAGNETAKVVHD